jgi:hypothetical protein
LAERPGAAAEPTRLKVSQGEGDEELKYEESSFRYAWTSVGRDHPPILDVWNTGTAMDSTEPNGDVSGIGCNGPYCSHRISGMPSHCSCLMSRIMNIPSRKELIMPPSWDSIFWSAHHNLLNIISERCGREIWFGL